MPPFSPLGFILLENGVLTPPADALNSKLSPPVPVYAGGFAIIMFRLRYTRVQHRQPFAVGLHLSTRFSCGEGDPILS
jgi:hypothetical protein